MAQQEVNHRCLFLFSFALNLVATCPQLFRQIRAPEIGLPEDVGEVIVKRRQQVPRIASNGSVGAFDELYGLRSRLLDLNPRPEPAALLEVVDLLRIPRRYRGGEQSGQGSAVRMLPTAPRSLQVWHGAAGRGCQWVG